MGNNTRRPLTTEENYEVNNIKKSDIYFFNISPRFPDAAFLEWAVNEYRFRLHEGLRPQYEYNIYRSHSPKSQFSLLNSSPITDPFYLDESIEQFTFDRTQYYKVEAISTNLSTPITLTSSPTALLADTHGLKRRRYLDYNKIKRDRRIQLGLVTAEMYYLKKNQTGERCSECWDPISKSILNTKCDTCFGTGFVLSYFSPIRVLVEHSQEQRRKDVTTKGYSEVNLLTIIIQDSPRVNRDDILWDPNNDRLYKIISYQQTMLNKTPLTQMLSVTELARDSVEYRLDIESMSVVDLYPTIEKTRDMKREERGGIVNV